MRRVVVAASATALTWAAIVAVTGGIDWRIAGIAVRSRDPFRAALVGVLLLLVDAVIFPREHAANLDRVEREITKMAPMLAAACALALALHAVAYGTFVASGADSYGYVSQAYGWYHGQLPAPSPAALTLPFPTSDMMQAPLGYRVGTQPHTIVPTYAPGLPLMMAAALPMGACGPFLIVPICAALFVWLTFLFGRRAAGPVAGLGAAVMLVISPVVLYQAVWPMSDIPAGALWTGAALAALGTRRRAAAAAGGWTGAGLLVRPNLPLLVLVPLAWVVTGARGRERWVRAALFCGPIAVAVVITAALNAKWYGAPLNSGYGGAGELYAWSSVLPNVRRYIGWLWDSQSGFVLVAILPFVPRWRDRISMRPLWLAGAMFLGVLLCYVAYFEFEDWWYLRFLLPGFGGLAVLLSCGIAAIARRVPPLWGRVTATLILIALVLHGLRYSRDHSVFGVRDAERRYVHIASVAHDQLPTNAVVVAMQHSGTVRFYGGRYTLRYDFIDPDWANRVVPELERLGYHPFLLIDDWEMPSVRRQFHLAPSAPVPWQPIARYRAFGGVRIYDMGSQATAGIPVSVDPSPSSWCAAPQPIELRAGR